jgi:hypothetical protein
MLPSNTDAFSNNPMADSLSDFIHRCCAWLVIQPGTMIKQPNMKPQHKAFYCFLQEHGDTVLAFAAFAASYKFDIRWDRKPLYGAPISITAIEHTAPNDVKAMFKTYVDVLDSGVYAETENLYNHIEECWLSQQIETIGAMPLPLANEANDFSGKLVSSKPFIYQN